MTVEETITINTNDLVLIVNAIFVFGKAICSHFGFHLILLFFLSFYRLYLLIFNVLNLNEYLKYLPVIIIYDNMIYVIVKTLIA